MAEVLQINFKIEMNEPEYKRLTLELAEQFADVPGLVWKVWTLNPTKHEAGGIYLFDSAASLETYLASPLARVVRDHPQITGIDVKQFDVVEDATAMTRGPVNVRV